MLDFKSGILWPPLYTVKWTREHFPIMFFTARRHSDRSAVGLTGSYETLQIDQAEVRTKCANSILVRISRPRAAAAECAMPTGSGQACRNQCATASLADWFECTVMYVALHEGASRLFALTTSRFGYSGKPGILGNQRGRGYG